MQKISIKREQSQAGLSFAERKNFRPKVKRNRLLLLLVLLMTAATGAWATDVYLVGNGDGNWLNGAAWDPGVAGNKMTEQNGVYSITFKDVDANSELQFKFALNGTWDVNYGCTSWDANELNKTLSNIEEFGNNIMFGLTEKADVTISFNLSELTYMISTKGMKVGDDAAATYTVSMKDGVKDADKWTITPNPAEEGQTVTLQYNGRLKVKGVKATSEAPAEATPALSITSPSVGQVIGSDGKNYAYGSLPTGVTAVAKICYVSGSNGLALALTDEGYMEWSTAIETCAAHTPAFTGGTWKLASKDEWDNMITAAVSYTDLRDGFNGVGGTNMESNYWSSTESNAEGAWYYYFDYGGWADAYKDTEGNAARACLAFTVEQAAPAKTPATVTTAPTATTGDIAVGSEKALVSGGVADGGTLMYAVTTTNTKPTSTDGFSDAVPTAKTLAAGTYYVWYYVKGDDSHTDSEISATAIAVTVKAAAPATITVTINKSDWGKSNSFTKDGVTVSAGSIDSGLGNLQNGGSFSTTLGNFTKIVVTCNMCSAYGNGWSGSNSSKTWAGTPASTVNFSGNFMGMGNDITIVCTIQPTN